MFADDKIVTKKLKTEDNPDWQASDNSEENETTLSMTSTSGETSEGGGMQPILY